MDLRDVSSTRIVLWCLFLFYKEEWELNEENSWKCYWRITEQTINEEDKFQMQEIDTAFDYIPDENKQPKNKKNNDTRF